MRSSSRVLGEKLVSGPPDSGRDTGQRRIAWPLAQATHDGVVARVGVSGRTVKHAPARGFTVRAFDADWIAKRWERELDRKNDESRLKRRHYDMRATFITLAIEDGADPDVLVADALS